jgi:ATP-dependent helicase/nuclease subunit B
MSAGHLFSIAPHAPFLDTLADRVLDGTLLGGWVREGPFWLSDVTIILPTRRARMALAERFMARRGGRALLPDIRTFGGEPEEDEPFLSPHDAPAPVPAVSVSERRLALARLIADWATTGEGRDVLATPPSAPEILALADSLAEIVDSIAIEGADIRCLDTLEQEHELALNWQRTRAFLMLVLERWPALLSERGKADAATLRNERLMRQAQTIRETHGERPIIAAGSTGSIPATAALLAAISRLPRGAVVLPGLDTSLDLADHAALQDEKGTHQGHPQYGLSRLIAALHTPPAGVIELAPEADARTAIVNRALALAEDTARWTQHRKALAPRLEEALRGVTILAAPAADEEARAIAVAACDGLARGKRVGIVSPDRNLARRISAELKRFEVTVEDTAGTPLFHSAAGRLARQVLAAIEGDFAPVDLMALLRNRAVLLGMKRRDLTRLADELELRLLRGQLVSPGAAGLRRALAANLAQEDEKKRLSRSDGDGIALLIERLEAALSPLAGLLAGGRFRAGDFACRLAEALSAIGDPELPGAPELAGWAAELHGYGDEGPAILPVALDGVLGRLTEGFTVRAPAPEREDIRIWGELEARLQSPDLMILCGVNDDIWPRAADPGPWLSRGMRVAIGLEPPERQQGLAAHDFIMALGNAEVIVAFAGRIGTSPASPSRFLQRLEAFLGEGTSKVLRARGEKWLRQARRLDAVDAAPQPAMRPSPAPPAAMRPRRLSVTEVEKLFRSPYDLYARHVLRLRALDPLGQEPGGRERGTLIHDVFGRFVAEGHAFDDTAQARLEAMADEAFGGMDALPERRAIWLKRFAVAARLFLEFERAREEGIATRHAEQKGEWMLPGLEFKLTGRADRVDRLADGTFEILDFKTGSVPSPGDMKAFMAPQLLLEAAMARAVGIGSAGVGEVSALTYIKIGQGPDAYRPRPFAPANDDLRGAIEGAAERLMRHLDALLLRDDLPMAARIVPDARQRFRGEFDHLARTDEWLVQEDEDVW